MNFYTVSFLFFRFLALPLSALPYSTIQSLGNFLGICAYHLLPKFRKRTLSNLSLANLDLSEEKLIALAKASFQNLMITCLEYPKLSCEKKISRIATCENPGTALNILNQGKGVIFFCGHQANWEILFLEGTSRMPGVAIGRPIKNTLLYNWVLQMRQKFGGTIIAPKNAIRESLRAIKQNKFLGIVGDQGMPDSGFSSPFLGRMAWTSPIPALLSYRTQSPIIVATTKRKKGKYLIRYSEPIWPNPENDQEKEIPRLMHESIHLLETSIRQNPSQWLWIHNRWKQQTPDFLKKAFRHESILIILPQEKELFDPIKEHLSTFRDLYPHEFITLFIPKAFKEEALLTGAERLYYQNTKDLFIRDFRFKLVFDFSTTGKALRSHFLSLSAFTVATLQDLKNLAKGEDNLSNIFTKAVRLAP